MNTTNWVLATAVCTIVEFEAFLTELTELTELTKLTEYVSLSLIKKATI
jgi:hypothetical protein